MPRNSLRQYVPRTFARTGPSRRPRVGTSRRDFPERQKRPSGLNATEFTPSVCPLERPDAAARRGVPKAERGIIASRETEASVGAERHGIYVVSMSLERPRVATRRGVRELEYLVIASREAEAAVGAERHGIYIQSMSLERPHAATRRGVPKAERPPASSREAEAAVGAERNGIHTICMSLERPHAAARTGVPKAERLVAARRVGVQFRFLGKHKVGELVRVLGSRQAEAAVGAERYGIHFASMSLERPHALARRGVPTVGACCPRFPRGRSGRRG